VSSLQERVANALRKVRAVEAAYQTTTVPQLVALRARTHGSQVALDVFDRNERATYEEMDRLSNRYARALRGFGVRKGDCVAIMLPNRLGFALLWFALAKLGAVMLPVNVRYTPREVEYVVSDAMAKFAIVDESSWPVFGAMAPWPSALAKERVIHLDSTQLFDGVDDAPIDEDVQPDDLLNIQYTSGTTGFPKGCMLTHEYWAISACQSAYWDAEPRTRYLSAQPFFYADPQGHLLKSYWQGGTLYLAPQLSSSRFLDWVRQYGIEWCSFPELVAKQAAANGDDGKTPLKQISKFSWSGESIRRFREQFGVPGGNGYGMTEIGWPLLMPADITELNESASVGIRAPFRESLLANEDGSPTPIGELGELWVRGRGMFKGYWRRPETNATSFEGDWFKTGDLMRRNELGFFWLCGRKKEMIRRSSENIAAHEVEAVICEIPGVAGAAAVPVKDAKRGEEVKVYVELKPGVTRNDVSVERILDHARAHLAAFKVPRYLTYIDTIPRITSSNKALKRELTDIPDPLAGAYDSEEKRWR
jgi:acyl-CoA synthetase (AMP-forming)/AMP-acid ligase II